MEINFQWELHWNLKICQIKVTKKLTKKILRKYCRAILCAKLKKHKRPLLRQLTKLVSKRRPEEKFLQNVSQFRMSEKSKFFVRVLFSLCILVITIVCIYISSNYLQSLFYHKTLIETTFETVAGKNNL